MAGSYDLQGKLPESWCCVDCGVNTAPGLCNRAEMERAFETADEVEQVVNNRSEVYTVSDKVWKKAGMQPMGGCLCIECLEKRLGRRLKPRDFLRDDAFNKMPGTARLLNRQKRLCDRSTFNYTTTPEDA